MSELDILNLARSCGQTISSDFAQVITITFGMRLSWVGIISNSFLNLVFWVLWLGTGYMLFFWRKPRAMAPPHD